MHGVQCGADFGDSSSRERPKTEDLELHVTIASFYVFHKKQLAELALLWTKGGKIHVKCSGEDSCESENKYGEFVAVNCSLES